MEPKHVVFGVYSNYFICNFGRLYVNKSDKNAYSLKTNIAPKTYTFLPQFGPKT